MRQTTLTGEGAPQDPRGGESPKVAAILWIAPIAIDRNGFRRMKEEGLIYKILPQVF